LVKNQLLLGAENINNFESSQAVLKVGRSGKYRLHTKMILICEIRFTSGHVPFNAGLLAMIRAAFPAEDLSFFGAAEQIEALKKQVGEPSASSIHWHEIPPIPLDTPYGKKLFRELCAIRCFLKILPQDSASRLVLSSAAPSTVLALKIARCFRFKTTVQVILHGLRGVVGKRYRHPIRRLQDMKSALTLLGNQKIQYLVLEQSIRDTVVNRLPQLSGNVEALEHPIAPNEGPCQPIAFNEPLRLGFLGNTLEMKGFPLFVETANAITARYACRVEFHVIGRSKDHKLVNGITALATKPARKHVTRDEFIRGVERLHFIILPHEAARYTLAASGVMLDAIAWEKPVIARKIPIFEAMFDRYGDIGYLFSNGAELTDVVERILITADKSRYYGQVTNLQGARKSRTPESLAAAYREICMKSF
jgi:hypothetical protein